ncbi:MAG: helix-turn-helix domain-containing protein [Nannocystaceae bacterium]
MSPADPEGARAIQRRRTRAAILAAARARFTEGGYERATIREIADAAGVAVGSVHAHFRDKEALLFACFYANIEAAVATIWAGHDEAAPLVDQLTRCARILYEAYAAHIDLSRVMIKASLFHVARADEVEVDPLEPYLARIAGLYRSAAARGEIRLRVDGGLAAESYFAHYLAVLLGGLSGRYPAADGPEATAAGWAAHLRAFVALQLEGMGVARGDAEEERS